jgi:hypothetical protein
MIINITLALWTVLGLLVVIDGDGRDLPRCK